MLESIIVLKSGGILVAPTDTIYGLIGNATDEEVVKKVCAIKVRKNNPIPVFVDSFKMFDDVAYVREEKKKKFLEKVWPGKITCVLSSRGWMPMELRSGGGLNIGVRIPKHDFLLSLIKSFAKPVTATSANISGKEGYEDPQKVINDFKYLPLQPDLIIDAGILEESKSSTVIDLTKEPPEIIREGAISREEIFKIL